MRGKDVFGKRAQTRISRGLVSLVLLVGAVPMLAPFLWMLSTALKPLRQIFVYPPVWIPSPVEWENFYRALTYLPFPLFFRNTMTIAIGVIVGSLISNTLVAYGFARLRFPGRDILFIILISTTMIPWMVTLVPVFLLFHKLGWVNTLLPLIVPAYFGTPFYIFLLRQFFRSIPLEISDAAKIDGCSELGIYLRIVLPLSGPVLAVMIIFSFQGVWNDFLRPLVFLNERRMKTLALGLYEFRGLEGGGTQWNLLMAASVLMVMPVILLFASFQRYFIQGVRLSGIKR